MGNMIPFTNFTKGEISPELQARIDTNQYAAGARKAKNFIIQRYGGLAFRPGFRFVGEADSATNTLRYIPFQFNIEQAYVIILENYTIRFLAGGGFILEDCVGITGITKAASAVVTAPYHGYNVGDRVFFDGIGGMTQINGMYGTVTAKTTSTITVNINSTSFGTFTSSTCAVRASAPSPPPPPPTAPPPPPPTPPPPATQVCWDGSVILATSTCPPQTTPPPPPPAPPPPPPPGSPPPPPPDVDPGGGYGGPRTYYP